MISVFVLVTDRLFAKYAHIHSPQRPGLVPRPSHHHFIKSFLVLDEFNDAVAST
jgi:hypothetical protein